MFCFRDGTELQVLDSDQGLEGPNTYFYCPQHKRFFMYAEDRHGFHSVTMLELDESDLRELELEYLLESLKGKVGAKG